MASELKVTTAKPPHISVVDDDESVRESLSGLMRSVGFAVTVFASAEEFLSSVYLRNTDCLILDVRMPGMNGLDLQSHLEVTRHQIPLVFVTAHGHEEARQRALNGGAVGYLLKPFSEEALLKAIDAALQSKRIGSRQKKRR
jgi:FixJ family two-component response regulator